MAGLSPLLSTLNPLTILLILVTILQLAQSAVLDRFDSTFIYDQHRDGDAVYDLSLAFSHNPTKEPTPKFIQFIFDIPPKAKIKHIFVKAWNHLKPEILLPTDDVLILGLPDLWYLNNIYIRADFTTFYGDTVTEGPAKEGNPEWNFSALLCQDFSTCTMDIPSHNTYPYRESIKYVQGIPSELYLHQWPVSTTTTHSPLQHVFEMVLTDAFLAAEDVKITSQIDFFDIKFVGYLSFAAMVSGPEARPIRGACLLNKVPVSVQLLGTDNRQLRVYLTSSLSADRSDESARVRQIIAKRRHRLVFECTDTLRVQVDWRSGPYTYTVLQLGHQRVTSISTYEDVLYPDFFFTQMTPLYSRQFSSAPPALSEITTEWNPALEVLTMSWLANFTQTTALHEGLGENQKMVWDSRHYLLPDTNFTISSRLDDMVFDLAEFDRQRQDDEKWDVLPAYLPSTSGHVGLFIYPELSFTQDYDYGPMFTYSSVLFDSGTASPYSSFEFLSNEYDHTGTPTCDELRQQADQKPFSRSSPVSPYGNYAGVLDLDQLEPSYPVRFFLVWHLPDARFCTPYPLWSSRIQLDSRKDGRLLTEQGQPAQSEIATFHITSYFNVSSTPWLVNATNCQLKDYDEDSDDWHRDGFMIEGEDGSLHQRDAAINRLHQQLKDEDLDLQSIPEEGLQQTYSKPQTGPGQSQSQQTRKQQRRKRRQRRQADPSRSPRQSQAQNDQKTDAMKDLWDRIETVDGAEFPQLAALRKNEQIKLQQQEKQKQRQQKQQQQQQPDQEQQQQPPSTDPSQSTSSFPYLSPIFSTLANLVPQQSTDPYAHYHDHIITTHPRHENAAKSTLLQKAMSLFDAPTSFFSSPTTQTDSMATAGSQPTTSFLAPPIYSHLMAKHLRKKDNNNDNDNQHSQQPSAQSSTSTPSQDPSRSLAHAYLSVFDQLSTALSNLASTIQTTISSTFFQQTTTSRPGSRIGTSTSTSAPMSALSSVMGILSDDDAEEVVDNECDLSVDNPTNSMSTYLRGEALSWSTFYKARGTEIGIQVNPCQGNPYMSLLLPEGSAVDTNNPLIFQSIHLSLPHGKRSFFFDIDAQDVVDVSPPGTYRVLNQKITIKCSLDYHSELRVPFKSDSSRPRSQTSTVETTVFFDPSQNSLSVVNFPLTKDMKTPLFQQSYDLKRLSVVCPVYWAEQNWQTIRDLYSGSPDEDDVSPQSTLDPLQAPTGNMSPRDAGDGNDANDANASDTKLTCSNNYYAKGKDEFNRTRSASEMDSWDTNDGRICFKYDTDAFVMRSVACGELFGKLNQGSARFMLSVTNLAPQSMLFPRLTTAGVWAGISPPAQDTRYAALVVPILVAVALGFFVIISLWRRYEDHLARRRSKRIAVEMDDLERVNQETGQTRIQELLADLHDEHGDAAKDKEDKARAARKLQEEEQQRQQQQEEDEGDSTPVIDPRLSRYAAIAAAKALVQKQREKQEQERAKLGGHDEEEDLE